MKPELEIYSHVDESVVSSSLLELLLETSNRVLKKIVDLPEGPEHVLSGLDVVEVSLVTDDVISRIHADYLNDPSVTDVITFPYDDGTGEVIISVDTAMRQAVEYGEDWHRELFRYIVHGLLHLHGYLDSTSEERQQMFSCQEPLVEEYGLF